MGQRVGSSHGTVATRHGKPVKLSPAARIYGLGAILLLAMTICSRRLGSMGALSFIVPLAIAGVAYLFAVRELFSAQKFPRRFLFIGLALAALWHLPFLFA